MKKTPKFSVGDIVRCEIKDRPNFPVTVGKIKDFHNINLEYDEKGEQVAYWIETITGYEYSPFLLGECFMEYQITVPEFKDDDEVLKWLAEPDAV